MEVKREFERKTNALDVKIKASKKASKKEVDIARLEVFCEGMKGITLAISDGKSFDTKFYLMTKALIASCQLSFEYKRKEYEHDIDYHFGAIKIMMDGTSLYTNEPVYFSEWKKQYLISSLAGIDDSRAKEILNFLLTFKFSEESPKN